MSITNLEQSGCITDNVGELENVWPELLLHVTEEKHCIFGGEPADLCHCQDKVRQRDNVCPGTFNKPETKTLHNNICWTHWLSQPNCILQHVLKTCAICVYMSIPIFSKHSGITYMNQSNISANLTIGN